MHPTACEEGRDHRCQRQGEAGMRMSSNLFLCTKPVMMTTFSNWLDLSFMKIDLLQRDP
jgi:hypothetical protein